MKRISFFTAICLILVLSGCKKDSVENIPLGTFKVEIGGTKYTFNELARASRLQVTGGYGIQIQGNYRVGSTTNLTITIVRPTPITGGSYRENAASNPLVTMVHCTEVLFPCVLRAEQYGSTSNPVEIILTEVTGNSVRGTFKGELLSSSGGKEVLTNGQFYVRF